MDDLADFKAQLKTELKVELLAGLKLVLADLVKPAEKKWLKSWEVRKLLKYACP
jgi:hypothetical protein